MRKNLTTNLNQQISVDCCIFNFNQGHLNVLLIKRKSKNKSGEELLALPGDLVYNNETLNNAAERVLKELTDLEHVYLEQVGAFSDLHRLSKPEDKHWLKSFRTNPNARVITIGYYSLTKINENLAHPNSFAEELRWIPVKSIESLAFDHMEILAASIAALQTRIKTKPIGFNLLPKKFTLSQLQELYEAILDKSIDKRNFRRKMLKLGIIIPLDKYQENVSHKPAQYFSFDKEKYEALEGTGFDNFGF